MFARPRPKRSALSHPPPKKRKATPAIEEINFDDSARSEYLTGFHKRKLQRVKHAQDEAAKKARQERIDLRKQASRACAHAEIVLTLTSTLQVREDRQREVEDHVQSVKSILREAERAGHLEAEESSNSEDEEFVGFQDKPVDEHVDHEEEYVDEDRYTTVTVESVNISRDGFKKTEHSDSEDDRGAASKAPITNPDRGSIAERKRNQHTKKKQKFRYESKEDRRANVRRERAKKRRPT